MSCIVRFDCIPYVHNRKTKTKNKQNIKYILILCFSYEPTWMKFLLIL